MIPRLRSLPRRAVAHLPFSCARGVKAAMAGLGARWLAQAEGLARVLDALAGVVLLASAALALGALFWANAALAVTAALAMVLAVWCMVAGMWVERQACAVQDYAHLHHISLGPGLTR